MYFMENDDVKSKNKFEFIVAAAKRARELPSPITRQEGKTFQKRTTRSIEEIDKGKVEVNNLIEKVVDSYEIESKK